MRIAQAISTRAVAPAGRLERRAQVDPGARIAVPPLHEAAGVSRPTGLRRRCRIQARALR